MIQEENLKDINSFKNYIINNTINSSEIVFIIINGDKEILIELLKDKNIKFEDYLLFNILSKSIESRIRIDFIEKIKILIRDSRFYYDMFKRVLYISCCYTKNDKLLFDIYILEIIKEMFNQGFFINPFILKQFIKTNPILFNKSLKYEREIIKGNREVFYELIKQEYHYGYFVYLINLALEYNHLLLRNDMMKSNKINPSVWGTAQDMYDPIFYSYENNHIEIFIDEINHYDDDYIIIGLFNYFKNKPEERKNKFIKEIGNQISKKYLLTHFCEDIENELLEFKFKNYNNWDE